MASTSSQGSRKHNLSILRCLSSGKASFNGDHSLIGGPGFSRVVSCNDPSLLSYDANYVQTTKYTLATFLPKSLFEQFRRVANVYFLICALLSFTSLSPFSSLSCVLPFVAVIGVTMGKEIAEDWKRKRQDLKVNNRQIKVHRGDGNFILSKWKDLRVGDVVKVEKDELFPADIILLSSSYDDAICYVETMNLDGETSLKLKQGLDVTSHWQDDHSFQNFKALINCEDPNANLYTFVGSLKIEEEYHPLSPQQLLLRGSKLRNTDYIFGVVIFTGHDTKVIQNSTAPPSKRSKIEKRTDNIVYLLFFFLVLISIIGSIFFGIATSDDLVDGKMTRWYLRPDDTATIYNPKHPIIAAVLHFLTALMLYSYLIPISLYVSIEIVKVLQSIFINHDLRMYYEEADKPARARTSNLNEELGQVDTILSDKTGTLTCNSMEFIMCSVAGTPYGRGIKEIQTELSRKMGSHSDKVLEEEISNNTHVAVKGFNFSDKRILNGNWVNEPHSHVIQKFLQLLAICHTAIPDMDEETGRISYEAESPDEAAFVIAARELGFEFYERTQTSISLHELDPMSGRKVARSYTLLNILEFSSSRKRMSVILRNEEGNLILFSKGADSVMFERLSPNGREFEEKTKEHISEYAGAGFRTLVFAYREVGEEEYIQFNENFTIVKNIMNADRETMIEETIEIIEKDLILLGAVAIEDKLQNGVPECIDKLARAGIKIWVLTGDKMETAINIGFACNLLRQEMKQVTINSDTPEMKSLEKSRDKSAVAMASKASVIHQINEGKTLLGNSVAVALVIDGKSLSHALEDDVKDMFLDLAIGCSSVICCRSSPKQKALVTRLVKIRTGMTTLAIGDGANDVGMLQEADIGIGISGAEGMQAVMSSDISIAQFRFLEFLLLVHGHWCYRRISSMICYFFYKNIAFGFSLFFYEAYSSFSGQSAYNDWYLSLYNVFFTSLPVIALGVFDQDVSWRQCLNYPVLYQEGVQNVLFTWFRILGWACNGLLSAALIFFCCIGSTKNAVFHKGGEPAGLEILGTTMYTCVVWVVNCQMALSIAYFTYIQHLFIWGSIVLYYIFLLGYGAMNPDISTTAYQVFVETCAPDPAYWILTLFVLIFALLPTFGYTAIRMQLFPPCHARIHGVRGSDDDGDDMIRI